MIADIRHRGVPPFETLPASAQRRLITAFTLLADSTFYTHSLGKRGGDARFAIRLVGLLRAGVIRPDCGWLFEAGYIELVTPVARTRARQAPANRKKHDETVPDLDERTLVVLTAAGEAAATELLQAAAHDRATPHHVSVGYPRRPIRYDLHSRELQVDGQVLLRVPSIGRNMHQILLQFQQHEWGEQIVPAPLADLPRGKRVQAIRDSVHGLNTMQKVPQIQFGSLEKGTLVYFYVTAGARRLNRD